MKWLINNDLFIIPRPCIFACSNCQITLFGVVVVDFKEEIPRFAFLNEERVGNEFGGHIGDILRPEQWIDPALQIVEVERTVAAVNADRPLFTLGHEGNAAL